MRPLSPRLRAWLESDSPYRPAYVFPRARHAPQEAKPAPIDMVLLVLGKRLAHRRGMRPRTYEALGLIHTIGTGQG